MFTNVKQMENFLVINNQEVTLSIYNNKSELKIRFLWLDLFC